MITKNEPVHAKEVPIAKGRAINGLRAVFGEKYPSQVRVVSIGPTVEELLGEPSKDWGADYSIEFCGGTHMKSTNLAGTYVTLNESALAQGVRRITGVTGEEAREALANVEKISALLSEAKKSFESVLKVNGKERVPLLETSASLRKEIKESIDTLPLPAASVIELRGELQALSDKAVAVQKELVDAAKGEASAYQEKTLAEAKDSSAKWHCGELQLTVADSGAINACIGALSGAGLATLLVVKDEHPTKGKVVLMASVPKELQGDVKAGDIVKTVASKFDGKGGGGAAKAQATHAQLDKVAETVAEGKQFFESKNL